MSYNKIYAQDEGVIIIYNNTYNRFEALVNGVAYGCRNYAPLYTSGRTLREANRTIINRLYNEAIANKEADDNAEREALEATATELAERKAVQPKKSFAEVLEESFVQTLTEKNAEAMVEKIAPEIEKLLIQKFGLIPQIHEFKIDGSETKKVEGVLHSEFDNMLHSLMVGEPIYLYGKAGTGKSYITRQLAEALGFDFYYQNCITDKIDLTGFIDANGNYHETQFYKAFVNGGLLLIDELDASIPDALNTLNECLANGEFPFPTGNFKAHDNFRCVAAGNTFGTGGDNVYTGRYQLDGASLDRFAVYEVDYDEKIEQAIAEGDNELITFAHIFRKTCDDCGVNCLFTYRGIKRLHKFEKFMSKEKAIKAGLTKGLPNDDIQLLSNRISNDGNSWIMAFKNLVNI